jgi:ABC-type multidrug transport system ATPase subunit
MIETIGLSKIYSSGEGIRDINIKINPGEIFGILGPNGSGKSTLIKTLSTYFEPTAGSFKIFNYDNKKGTLEIRKNIGVLFEISSHFEELSGLENAIFFGEIYGVKDKKQTENLFKEIFLAEAKNTQVKNYSYGMKRKLSLIEVFLQNPKALLLDEPFLGLDSDSKFVLKEKLKKMAEEGKTILITTNEILETKEICGRIGSIDLGRIKKSEN